MGAGESHVVGVGVAVAARGQTSSTPTAQPPGCFAETCILDALPRCSTQHTAINEDTTHTLARALTPTVRAARRRPLVHGVTQRCAAPL